MNVSQRDSRTLTAAAVQVIMSFCLFPDLWSCIRIKKHGGRRLYMFLCAVRLFHAPHGPCTALPLPLHAKHSARVLVGSTVREGCSPRQREMLPPFYPRCYLKYRRTGPNMQPPYYAGEGFDHSILATDPYPRRNESLYRVGGLFLAHVHFFEPLLHHPSFRGRRSESLF